MSEIDLRLCFNQLMLRTTACLREQLVIDVSIRHALWIKNRHVTVIADNSQCITSEIPCVLGILKYVVFLNNRNRFNYKKRF